MIMFIAYFNCLLVFFIFYVVPTALYGQVKHVVMIGVDGMGSHGMCKAFTPVLDSLRRDGTYTLKAKAVYPTLSSPNWAFILKGVPPQFHGITSNKWKSEQMKDVPTIFKVLHEKDSLASIVAFYDWEDFSRLIEPDISAHLVNVNGDETAIQNAIEYFSVHKPVLTFIHLDQVDHQGHLFGEKSTEYAQAISNADSLIGTIVHAINKSEMRDSTVFLITADHGFKKKNHGRWSRREKIIPWIAAGAGIRRNAKICRKVYTYDTAATVAYLLSIPIPEIWKGKPVKEISAKNNSSK